VNYNILFKYFWPALFGTFALSLGIYVIGTDPAMVSAPISFFLSYVIYIPVNRYIKQTEFRHVPTTIPEYLAINAGWFIIFPGVLSHP